MVVNDKTKQKMIIRTYMILKQKATAKELADFINTYFKFKGGTSALEVSRLFTKNPNDPLFGVEKIETKPITYLLGDMI